MKLHIRTVRELAVRVAQDPALASKIRDNPTEAIAAVASPWESDVWIYRMVVGALGLAVLASIIGAIFIAMAGKELPQIFVALGSAAVGALAGLLAPSPAAES
jgi:hypothetical protein